MFVDTGLLHSGATSCTAPAAWPKRALTSCHGDRCFLGCVASPPAEAFHEAVSASHDRHLRKLQAHREPLTVVGGKAHPGADGFTAMDEAGAAKLRAVRCSSAT
ncbi:hypothetical protein MNAB215_4143 [Mycobacterium numidiamassiliense]|uniref:Uncharacterized protein n=1 Tax=Mycobacterium numidiamassiliense TaxID=1841861 RepID=A0A2U3PDS8_9MYCO|nr:hypothetical protein MNAB215_4143 [Mycobacterium numidiamassiliense]